MRRKPDLIVPIRDRRQHKRYLTLRNFRNALLVCLVAFVAISIRSEFRGTGPANYGRLYERELPHPPEPKPVEVVQEASSERVPDHTVADPMLVAPGAREQWLHADTAAPDFGAMPRAEASVARGETRVAIVGGPEGVSVVRQERRKPVLSGGFGR